MVPHTYPMDSNGYMQVREVTTTGLTEWVDYIPIQAVTDVAGKEQRHDDDGHIQVVFV